MVCSNCSGTGGARLMHIDLPKSEPWTSWAHFGVQYWFAPAATDPGISWEAHDQHQFLALVAPRVLCVRSRPVPVRKPDVEIPVVELFLKES